MKRKDAKITDMSKPTYDMWVACDRVWKRLTDDEQKVVKYIHLGKSTEIYSSTAVIAKLYSQYAIQNGITIESVRHIIDKAWKMWAIERGLADE